MLTAESRSNIAMIETHQFTLNNIPLTADIGGALYWPDRRTLVVSDLHFEKGTSYARRAIFLPPYDSRTTLNRLEAALARHAVERVICLGDSFHDEGAFDRLNDEDHNRLANLVRRYDWVWIEGNHDPHPPTSIGGRVTARLQEGNLTFQHEASAKQVHGEITGHFHPKAKVTQRGRTVSRPCFIEDGQRLIMPSFGAYTGGLNVLSPPIARHYPKGFTAHVIGQTKIHAIPSRNLRGDRAA